MADTAGTGDREIGGTGDGEASERLLPRQDFKLEERAVGEGSKQGGGRQQWARGCSAARTSRCSCGEQHARMTKGLSSIFVVFVSGPANTVIFFRRFWPDPDV